MNIIEHGEGDMSKKTPFSKWRFAVLIGQEDHKIGRGLKI